MSATPLAGCVIALDERTARLHLRALDALHRELSQVALPQLRAVNLARADLVRCLQVHAADGCATATSQMQPTARPGDTSSGEGVTPARDLLTVSEVARRYGMSATYVRRMAPQWNGTQIAGRWVIPAANITTTRRTSNG